MTVMEKGLRLMAPRLKGCVAGYQADGESHGLWFEPGQADWAPRLGSPWGALQSAGCSLKAAKPTSAWNWSKLDPPQEGWLAVCHSVSPW